MILIVLITLCAAEIHAQCPSPDFNIAATACRDQNLTLTNTSGPGTFQWDYCTGDLAGTPTASLAFTLPGANGRPSLEYAKDGNTWFAFATGTFSNTLFRLTFADGLQQPPLVENFGSLNGILKGPGSIRIIQNNGNWFGLLHNTDVGEILKLSFGSSLSNAFTTTSLITGIGNVNSGLAVGYDAIDGWVCLLSTPANQFKIIRLGANLSAPLPADILTTAAVPNPNNLFDVDLVKQCDQWYAFSSNIGDGNINRLSFGTSLFQQPVITALANLAVGNTCRLRVVEDGSAYYLAVATLGGPFYKVSLGNDLSNPTNTIVNEGTFSGVLQSPVGLGIALEKSVWTIGVLDGSNGQVASVSYPNVCSVEEFSANAQSPGIRYTQQGSYNVSLRMTNASGISKTITKAIVVSANSSPDISFTSQNICAGSNVVFTSENTSGGITSYDWDFGDASAHSNATQPNHIFSAAGTYTVNLTVAAANGCTNEARKTIKQYVAPVADFTLPGTLICTNNEYTFQNTTADGYDGNLSYLWKVDNVNSGSQRDLDFTFTSTGSKEVELVASIPGCSDSEVKTLSNVNTGPTVGFTFTGKCVSQPFTFTNTSTGSISGYSWTFGNGSAATTADASNTYATPGTYPVKLSTFGTNGCVSEKTENVPVYSLPVPAFSLDLPPFSCSGTPSQFHDNTPPPADSNIQSWTWSFGDSGTGSGKNPTHTYVSAGTYMVRLTTVTDKTCSAFVDQQVTIAQSPTPSFSSNPACASQATQFINTSTGNIKSYQWRIGNSSYTLKDPAHVFLTPGTYALQLSITDENNCAAVLDKQLVVPPVPVLEIDVKNACSGQPAVFTDITSGIDDVVASRLWTFNNSSTATGKEVTFQFSEAGSYPVRLQVQNQSGCEYSITRQFTIQSSPVAAFNASVESGPPPLSVYFGNSSTGAASWQWNFNDGTAIVTEESPTHVFQNLGQYPVDLTAIGAGGCRTTVSQPISVIVPFNELALSEFSVVQDQPGTPYKGYVRVTNAGNYHISGFTVFYEVGGGVRIREQVAATLNPGQTGLFLLSNEFVGTGGYICAELTDDNNLSNNKACATTGDIPVLLNSYPNPADAYITVETIQAAASEVRVRIYHASGGIAYDRFFDAGPGLSRLSLDVQNLSNGIYLVVVSSRTATSARRLMISH